MSVDPSNIAEEVIIDSEDNLEEEAVATEEETSEVTEASSDADVDAIVEEETIEEDTSPEDVDIDTVLETVDCEEIKSVLGDDLSEEDQTKIETIFTAAVREKSAEVSELIKESYAASNEKVLAEARETMSEQVDSYLDYIVEEWVKENQLAVESGVRGDIAESFIGGLKQLFEDHFISVPEGKYDLVESLQEKSDNLDEKINEEIEKNMQLHKELNAFKCREYFLESTRNLADTEVERLNGLSEDLSTDNFNDYQGKLDTLKEAYFSTPKAESAEDNADWAAIAGDEDTDKPKNSYVDPTVGSFASYISRQQKTNS